MEWDGRDLHVVIDHPNRSSVDDKLFRWQFESDKTNIVARDTTVAGLLVEAGIFGSKNGARNNWRRGFEFEEGMTRWERVGRLRRNIYVLKLPEDFPPYEDACL